MKKRFLTKKEEKRIVKAIRKAEFETSGEIRVHISFESAEDHWQKAVEVFDFLKMSETKDRNGVLFHVSPNDHKFIIIGDQGIDKKTPPDFWEEIKKEVAKKFKQGKYRKGLTKGIKMTGRALKKYFPYQNDDKNELPDEISWS
ncbi:MAG: TPM domain-containing protein [Weeksellaceae bacterium]